MSTKAVTQQKKDVGKGSNSPIKEEVRDEVLRLARVYKKTHNISMLLTTLNTEHDLDIRFAWLSRLLRDAEIKMKNISRRKSKRKRYDLSMITSERQRLCELVLRLIESPHIKVLTKGHEWFIVLGVDEDEQRNFLHFLTSFEGARRRFDNGVWRWHLKRKVLVPSISECLSEFYTMAF